MPKTWRHVESCQKHPYHVISISKVDRRGTPCTSTAYAIPRANIIRHKALIKSGGQRPTHVFDIKILSVAPNASIKKTTDARPTVCICVDVSLLFPRRIL